MIAVVVITRNEERNIERTLLSLKSDFISEIIVSDSNSNDKTRDIVKKVSIIDQRIELQSYANKPFTAARGRNEGADLCREKTKYILFLDGDMELKPGFIEFSIEKLSENESLAAVSGQMDNYFYDDSNELKYIDVDVYDVKKNNVGGAFMIRSTAFYSAGGFNSALIVNEESHLEFKLNKIGFEMKRFDMPMINHHTELPVSKKRLKERLLDRKITALGRNLYIGLYDVKYILRLYKDNPYTLISSMLFILMPLLGFINWLLPIMLISCVYFCFAIILKSLRLPINYFVYGAGMVAGFVLCLILGSLRQEGR
jgi:glycosyltransferase involved in cell wall biosynthesis